MANITKRTSKSGEISYLIRVFLDQKLDGKQLMKSMTWKPPKGMKPSAAEKQAQKEAVLFEEKARSGIVSVDSKMKFADYAERWMEISEVSPNTHAQRIYLLKRINAAIGHIPLEKLRADHLQEFYKNLRENGLRIKGQFAVASDFEEFRKAAGMTQKQLSAAAGVAQTTLIAAARGRHISLESANKFCAAMKLPLEKVFTIEKSSDKLSAYTIKHHHTLIRVILGAAKKSQIIPHNVAAEFVEAPKMQQTEAQYLNDEQARAFLAAMLDEPDIRIKTAILLALFTGMRRGELCGLSWGDIDFDENTIHVRRASQYIKGKGVVEVPTKNKSSVRDITVTVFVTELLKNYRTWWLEQKEIYGDEWLGFDERLFIKEKGEPIFPDTINRWLHKFTERNELPPIHPHTLRHTFITLQITSGVDVRTLQSRTGHSQASTLLDTYAHTFKSAQERAAQAMDDALFGNK